MEEVDRGRRASAPVVRMGRDWERGHRDGDEEE